MREYKITFLTRGCWVIHPLGRCAPGVIREHVRAKWAVKHLRRVAAPCRVYVETEDGRLFKTVEIVR